MACSAVGGRERKKKKERQKEENKKEETEELGYNCKVGRRRSCCYQISE